MEPGACCQSEPCHMQHSSLKWIIVEMGRKVFVLLSTGLGLPDMMVVVAVTCFPVNQIKATNFSKSHAFSPSSWLLDLNWWEGGERPLSHEQFPQSSSPSLEVLFLVNSYKSGPPWSILWEEAPGWNFVIKARFFSGGRAEEATAVAPPVLVSSWSA